MSTGTPETTSPRSARPPRRTSRRVKAAAATIGLAIAGVAALTPISSPASAELHSNTADRLPNNLYFGDVNGDGSTDLLQVAANKIFAFKTDYDGTPILHKYLDQNVSRLLVGDFTTTGREHGKDQVCAIETNNALSCYAISNDGTDLWWWFTQASFVASDEQAVVGDIDGDGADDVLVYKPSTGDVRAYTRTSDGFFHLMSNFALGNLATANRVNKKILLGEFGQATGRADLLLVDAANGQVSRYDSVTDAGKKTFWWAFTTATGAVSTNEDVSVARIENSTHDGLVLRNRVTGTLRFKRVEYASGQLAAATGANPGQLPVTTDAGHLYFAKTARFPSEPGGTVRDDALFLDSTDGSMRKYDARYDGKAYTYWWAYTKRTPALNAGWSGPVKDPWTVVLCKFKDVSTLPQDATFWRNHFTAGTGGVGDYYWDETYGSRDLYGATILGPYTMSYTSTEVAARMSATPQTWKRDDSVNACKDAATRAGATVPSTKTILYLNANAGSGASGGYVVADPVLNAPLALSHEMGHIYGLNDNADDQGNWYGDSYDLMSASGSYCYTGNPVYNSGDAACFSTATNNWVGMNAPSGPGMNAGNRIRLGFLPTGRVRLLTPTTTKQTVALDVTAIDRPEASATPNTAVQAIRIPIATGAVPECAPGNTCSTTGNFYTVELREPRGWDRAFTGTAVQVHKVTTTNGTIQTIQMTRPSRTLGAAATYSDAKLTVKVVSIDAARGTARVTVTY